MFIFIKLPGSWLERLKSNLLSHFWGKEVILLGFISIPSGIEDGIALNLRSHKWWLGNLLLVILVELVLFIGVD
jgi:hypothetical protein